MKPLTIRQAVEKYLDVVHLSRSKNTVDTYQFATRAFQASLASRDVDLDAPIASLTEESISWFAEDLKLQSAATEAVYLQAVRGFYKFLVAERLATINLPRLDLLKQQRARRLGVRLPQFPTSDIERLLEHVSAAAFVNGSGTRSTATRIKGSCLPANARRHGAPSSRGMQAAAGPG